jgi:hypothetical protein
MGNNIINCLYEFNKNHLDIFLLQNTNAQEYSKNSK